MDYIIPLLSYNVIFYSITSISTYLVSTQNVCKFIIDHKDNDYIIFQQKLESIDLINKLNIVNSLIKTIVKKYNINIDELLESKQIKENTLDDYLMIELHNINNITNEPIKISILSVLEIIIKINNLLEIIKNKIIEHNRSYIRILYTLNIHNEINKIISLNNIFNDRLQLLFEILKII